MTELGWLITYDPRMFVAQAIEKAIERDLLTDEIRDKMVRDAASISHHLMILRFQTTSAKYAARQGVEDAVRTINIGLQFASGGDLDRAANLISKNELVLFFRIGNTLINKLKREAKGLLERNLIYPPKSVEMLKRDIALIDALPIEIFNVLENRFLEKLLKGILTAKKEGDAVKLSSGSGRPISSLGDVRLAQRVLSELRLKSEYARSLPAKDFFTTKFFLDPTLDFILAATRHLMANIVLKGKIGYRLSHEEVESFKKEMEDRSTRRILLRWIERYMEERNKDEELKKFAKRFWLKAMSDLESFREEYW